MDVLITVAVGAIILVAIIAAWRLLAPKDPVPPASAGPTSHQVNMYDRLGPDVIRVAVDQFYHRMIGDPRLSPYFAGVDLSRLRRHQALFLGQVFGGPVHFQLHQLEAMHRRLRISRDTYWAGAEHLIAVLSGLSVPRDVLVHLFDALLDLEPLIVSGTRAAVD